MVRFLVFADLHYKKGMYAAGVEHLQAILERAASEQVDFVIHVGDLCNDYVHSPELTDAYLHNPWGLPVYGVYGNHELESHGNTMEAVTPLLCNREVTFGTEGVGYWHTDIGAYRIIGLDTNYSYNEERQAWEHNLPASWGAPQGNIRSGSLGPQQLQWLTQVLAEAAETGKTVLVFSHDGLSGRWGSTPDAEAVRELFRQYPGTVRLSVNGHLHTDHFAMIDNVAYFDVNAVQNGHWAEMPTHHYGDTHTYLFTDYDEAGHRLDTRPVALNTLSQGQNTWFFETPLSAVVTVEDDGTVTVAGSQTRWMHGVVPSHAPEGAKPAIPDRRVRPDVR